MSPQPASVGAFEKTCVHAKPSNPRAAVGLKTLRVSISFAQKGYQEWYEREGKRKEAADAKADEHKKLEMEAKEKAEEKAKAAAEPMRLSKRNVEKVTQPDHSRCCASVAADTRARLPAPTDSMLPARPAFRPSNCWRRWRTRAPRQWWAS